MSYFKIDLPGAPQSAHRLLCGCFTSSSKIFLFRSWFAISTQSRRLLLHDRARHGHWSWCYHRFNPRWAWREKRGTFLLFGVRNEWPPNFTQTAPSAQPADTTVHWRAPNPTASPTQVMISFIVLKIKMAVKCASFNVFWTIIINLSLPLLYFKTASKIHLNTPTTWKG